MQTVDSLTPVHHPTDRPYLRPGSMRDAFVAACVAEVQQLGLSGLNFDFEFPECGSPSTMPKGVAPCSAKGGDGSDFNGLLTDLKVALKAKGLSARVTVDTGESAVGDTAVLNATGGADRLISMGTYYSLWVK